MGASKRYRGKPCAYCGEDGVSSTADHVVARSFFLDEDRANLPQVPACRPCNNAKSALELNVGSTLLIGSRHPEGNRYRQEKIRPRLDKNAKLRAALNLDAPPEWYKVNGVWQQLHQVKVDWREINDLMGLIVRGLYMFHFNRALSPGFVAEAKMYPAEHEAAMWATLQEVFPPDAPRINGNLGRGGFAYSAVQSPWHPRVSAWELWWHGGIRLHGADGSANKWWCMTRATAEHVQQLGDEQGASPEATGL